MTYRRHHGGAMIGEPRPNLDLSVNLNYYGPPVKILEAVRTAAISLYPESTSAKLRQALSNRYGIDPSEIVVGNGACSLLWQLAQVFAPGPMMAIEPTFCEFAAACQSLGAELLRWQGWDLNTGELAWQGLANTLNRHRPRLCYLCNPNSPTGQYVGHADLMSFFESFSSTYFILDQAFLPLSRHHSDMDKDVAKNVLVLRSLTKDFAIAGLRLGYLIAPPGLARKLEAARPYWSVNSLAQVAGEVALASEGFLNESRQRILEDKRAFEQKLKAGGYDFVASETSFLMIKVHCASAVSRGLWERGIRVRDCSSYGLNQYIRVRVGTAEEVNQLMSALEEVSRQ